MDTDLLIIFGTIFSIVIGTQLISLAKKWIERNHASYDDEKFNRLAKAFISHKKDTERRLQNMEAIITSDEPASTPATSPKKELNKTQLHNTIEIDSDDSKKEHKKEDGGNLRNMLKE